MSIFTSAGIRLDLDANEFNKVLNRTGNAAESVLENMERSAEAFSASWKDLTSGIKDTKRIVSGIMVSQAFYSISNAVKDTAAAIFDFSQQMETAAMSMEYFVKGADKTAKSLAFLREMQDFAVFTSFSTSQSVAMSKYLQAMGVRMNATKSMLKVITDTAAATGATEQNLQRVVFGIGQILTKGRLANEEIRQLANANIPIYEILQEELGMTGEQISKIGKSWVSAEKAVNAILTGLEKRYAGASEKLAQTVPGMFETIKDGSLMIAQIATSGIYDTFADKLTIVRDAVERYRQITMETGGVGLFRQILLDIDVTGRFGAEILALIGNLRQLGSSFFTLYNAAKPVLRLFKDSLYASVSVFSYALTTLAHAATAVIKELDRLGITSGTLGRVLAALYITYRVGKWLAFLGQGATSAVYSVINLTRTIWNLVPAIANASVGVKLLTTGIIGGIAAFAAYAGIINMVNNSLAGLDATASGSTLLPDDFNEAYEEYQKKLEEYNKAIEKYQEDFNDPFSELGDSASDAFDDVEDEAKKSAKKVKETWLASFDEVFAIPQKEAEDAFKMPKAPDFGALLKLPSIKFPSRGDKQLEAPKFDFKDVLSGSPFDNLNSDVLKPNWWISLLGAFVPMLTMGIGKWFAENKPFDDKKQSGLGGGKQGSAINSRPENIKALKDITKQIKLVNDKIGKAVARLEDNSYDIAALETVRELVPKAEALTDKATHIYKLLGEDKQVISDVAEAAKKYIANDDFRRAAEQYEKGDLSIAELDKLYQKTARIAGSLDEFKDLATKLGVTVEEKFKKLTDIARSLADEISSSVNVPVSKLPIGETPEGVLMQLFADNADKLDSMKWLVGSLKDLFIDENVELERLANTVLNIDKDVKVLSELRTKLDELQATLKNKDAFVETGKVIDAAAVSKAIKSTETMIRNKLEQLQVKVSSLEVISSEARKNLEAIQHNIRSGNAFKNITTLLARSLPQIYNKMLAIDKYSSELFLTQQEGIVHIKDIASSLRKTAELFSKDIAEPVRHALQDLAASVDASISASTVPTGIAATTSKVIDDALQQVRNLLSVDTSVTEKYFKSLYDEMSKQTGIFEKLTNIQSQMQPVKTTPKHETPRDKLFEALDNKLSSLEEAAKTIQDFDDGIIKIIDYLEKNFPEDTVKYQRVINEEFEIARQDFLKQLEPLTSAAKIVKEQYKKVARLSDDVKAMRAARDQLKPLLEKEIGNALTRASVAPEKLVSDIIKQGGLFNPRRAMLGAADIAGLYGLSGYGNTVPSAIIDKMLESERDALGLVKGYKTTESLVRMAYGKLAEGVILVEAQNKLLERGLEVSKGDVIYNKEGTLKAEIDGLLWKQDKLITSIDAKFLANQDKINNILSLAEKQADGIFAISADKFDTLIGIADDIAYQIAAQSAIIGKTADRVKHSVYLAIMDAKKAGINFNIAQYAPLDPTIPKGAKAISSLAEENAARQLRALTKDILSESISVVEVEIPDNVIARVEQFGIEFKEVIENLSKLYSKNGPVKDVLKLINKSYEVLGDKIVARFESTAVPTFEQAPLNSLLRDIARQLNNTNEAVRDMGRTRLTDLIEKLTNAYWDGRKEGVDRVIALDIPYKNDVAHITMNTGQIKYALEELKGFAKSIDGRLVALTNEVHDGLKFINRYVGSPLQYTPDTRSDYTLRQRIESIRASADKLEKILNMPGALTSQLEAMIARNVVLPVSGSPLNFAGISEYSSLIKMIADSTDTTVNDAIKKLSGSTATAFKDTLKELLSDNGGYIRLDAGINFDWFKQLFSRNKINATINGETVQARVEGTGAGAGAGTKGAGTTGNNPPPGYKFRGYTSTGQKLYEQAKEPTVYDPLTEQLTSLFKQLYIKFITSGKNTSIDEFTDMYGRVTKVYSKSFKDDFAEVFYQVQKDQQGRPLGSGGGGVRVGDAIFSNKQILSVLSGIGRILAGIGAGQLIGSTFAQNLDLGSAYMSGVKGNLTLEEGAAADKRAAEIFAKYAYSTFADMIAAGTLPAFNPKSIASPSGVLDYSMTMLSSYLQQYKDMTDAERNFWYDTLFKTPEASGFAKFMQGPAGSDQIQQLTALMRQAQKELGISSGSGIATRELFEALYNTDIDNSQAAKDLKALVDHVIKTGDNTSEIAKHLYGTSKNSGAKVNEMYADIMRTVIAPAYGVTDAWLRDADAVLGVFAEQINATLSSYGYAPIETSSDIPLYLKPYFDELMSSIREYVEAPLREMMEVTKEFRAENFQTRNNNMPGIKDVTNLEEYLRAGFTFFGDTTGIAEAVKKDLAESYGIVFKQLTDDIAGVTINLDAFSNSIMGWVQELPDSFNIESLSAKDVSILAEAGIQINGDGTITFMKPLDLNMSGESRELSLTADDLAQAIVDAFKVKGLEIDLSSAEAAINITDFDKLLGSSGDGVSGALFKMSRDLTGQVSEIQRQQLAELGTILDSGFLQITNSAILSGQQTAKGYLESLGYTFNESGEYVSKSGDVLSGEIIKMLQQIDNVIAMGGERTAKTVAQMADGIIIKSPINADELTDEIEAAFAAAGYTFQEYGDELYLTINKIGEQWKEGITRISAEAMSQLSPAVRMMLENMGVIFDDALAQQTGFWTVQLPDITKTGIEDLVSLYVNSPTSFNALPEGLRVALEQLITTTDVGLAELKLQTGLGLQNLGNEWYQYWDQLPQKTIDALAAVATSASQGMLDVQAAAADGVLKIEAVTENTKIPDILDEYVIVPFNSLPDEIRTSMGDAAKELEGKNVIITDSTKTAFAGMETAVQEAFARAESEASSGANAIVQAVSAAFAEINRLNNLSVKDDLFKQWGWKKDSDYGEDYTWSGSAGRWSVRYKGSTYYSDAATKEQAIQDILKKYGVRIPGLAGGGVITDEAIFRAGELGRKEAIVPLENRGALALVGRAISDSIMANISQPALSTLKYIMSKGNAGLATVQPQPVQQSVDTSGMAKDFLEYVIPALANMKQDNEDKPLLVVQNLIADDYGLTWLEERMRIAKLRRGEA